MELNLVEFKFSLMRCSKIIQEYILNQWTVYFHIEKIWSDISIFPKDITTKIMLTISLKDNNYNYMISEILSIKFLFHSFKGIYYFIWEDYDSMQISNILSLFQQVLFQHSSV
jgi:hypothetical protein